MHLIGVRHAGLSSVGRRVSYRIIKSVPIPGGRINKTVAVFPYIHRLKQHVFEISRLGIFDEHAGRAIEPPHLETRAEESAIGEKLVQTGHGVKAIDGDSILSIEAVVGPVSNGSCVDEALALDGQANRPNNWNSASVTKIFV